jgi:hypothetical protein
MTSHIVSHGNGAGHENGPGATGSSDELRDNDPCQLGKKPEHRQKHGDASDTIEW